MVPLLVMVPLLMTAPLMVSVNPTGMIKVAPEGIVSVNPTPIAVDAFNVQVLAGPSVAMDDSWILVGAGPEDPDEASDDRHPRYMR